MKAADNSRHQYRYRVERLQNASPIDSHWSKPQWQKASALSLDHFMGKHPAHSPKVSVKMLYDPQAMYVIFHVEDRFVKAVSRTYQDAVFRDSCVEFFFVPGQDLSTGYFNLEVNCGGIALFHYQRKPKTDVFPVTEADFQKLKIAHSLPSCVDPEIETPLTWTVEYRLPFEILSNYAQSVILPQRGTIWRANFFKCADASSHPHWLTWAKVNFPTPRFHLPEYFGSLEFM